MTDAAANTGAGDAATPNSGIHTYECGKEALNRLVDRTKHAISGARFSIERCPDASPARAAKGAAVMGGLVTAGSFLAKRSWFFLAAAGVGGALLGALSSRYHVSFDWDPDRAFGGQKSELR